MAIRFEALACQWVAHWSRDSKSSVSQDLLMCHPMALARVNEKPQPRAIAHFRMAYKPHRDLSGSCLVVLLLRTSSKKRID